MNAKNVKLDEIANIKVGYQSRKRINEDFKGTYTVIRPQDFSIYGELASNTGLRFSPTIDPARYLVEAGDILVLARGHHHFARLIVDPVENAVAANTFYIVRVKDQGKIIPAYLSWWINQPIVQAYFHQQQGKSTIPFISKSALQNCIVQIPPLETQEKIAGSIHLLERERQLTHRLIEKKDDLVQALCRSVAMNSGKE